MSACADSHGIKAPSRRWLRPLFSAVLVVSPLCVLRAFGQDCMSAGTCTRLYPTGSGLTPTSQPINTNFPPVPSCVIVVNNSCPSPVMVPFKTNADWNSFYDNHPSCISAYPCSDYEWISEGCGSNPCSTAGSCGPGTCTNNYYCEFTGNGSVVPNAYCADSGSPPTTQSCDTTSTYACGQCGSAAGGVYSTAPMSNLCVSGNTTSGAVAGSACGSTSWQWTCTGYNDNSSGTCCADLAAGCGTDSTNANGYCNGNPPPTGSGELCIQYDTNTAASVSGSTTGGGGHWQWTCYGYPTTISVACTATSSQSYCHANYPNPD